MPMETRQRVKTNLVTSIVVVAKFLFLRYEFE